MSSSASLRLAAATALSALALALAGLAAAATDWERFADEQRVTAITADEDGSVRETTVWILVLDGDAFLRTGPTTRWGRNVARDPRIAVRVAGEEIPVRVELIDDTDLRERVVEGFRAKYGMSDRVVALMRFGEPMLMRLASRVPEAEAIEPAPGPPSP